jgi:hypothetical protein
MKQRYRLSFLLLTSRLAHADALSALGYGRLLELVVQVVLVVFASWLLITLVVIIRSIVGGASAGWTFKGTLRFLSTLVGVAAGVMVLIYIAAGFAK